MRTKTWLLLVALPATLLALVAARVVWTAQRSLTRSAEIAQAQGQVRFTLSSLDSATRPNEAFEPVAPANSFTSGLWFAGELYLAGPGGLVVYEANGKPLRTLGTGLELPVAPIVAMASGRLRGQSEPHVLLATAGAGLLLLDARTGGTPTLHQVLPETTEARDLTALLPLASGDLLLGTRHDGILLFNGTTLTPLSLGSGKLDITALASVDSASWLIGTRNAGAFYMHAGMTEHLDAGSGLPDDQVESLAVAGRHAYIGTPIGIADVELAATDGPRVARILAPGTFSHALAFDPAASQLLAGTLDQGVREVSLGARPQLRHIGFTRVEGELPAQRVDQFVPTAGALYALTQGRLLRRDTAGWISVLDATTAGLADRNISALAFAPDGSLYVGFFDHGLDIVPTNAPGSIRHFEDDHLFCVNRLVLDPRRETMTVATANGLVLFDRAGTPRQVLTRRDGLISEHVSDIAYTHSGMTLATPAGLTNIGPAGAESVYAFHGLVNNHVYALSGSTENERILAGTLGGLSLLDSGEVKRNLTAANSGLKHNWITALAASPEGGWLVGTYGAGVLQLPADGNRFTPVELPAGTPRDLVINSNAILVTRTHIYVGTLGHGMLVLNRAASRWSVIDAGLPSLNVTAFAERDGVLYVGTENGLVRIAEARL